MKVKELIRRLQCFEEDMQVHTLNNMEEVKEVGEMEVMTNNGTQKIVLLSNVFETGDEE